MPENATGLGATPATPSLIQGTFESQSNSIVIVILQVWFVYLFVIVSPVPNVA